MGNGLAQSVQAGFITVDPDSFSEGDNISNAFPFVTLSAVGGGFGSGPDIFAVNPSIQTEPFNASTGTLVFGTDSSVFPHLFRELGFLHMRVDFDSPVPSVSLDYIGNNSSDQGELLAFNSSNVMIGSGTTTVLTLNEVGTILLDVGANDIAYVLAGGVSSSSSIGIDHLQYLMPAPSAFACPCDLNGDNIVGVTDLFEVLAAWGTDPGGPPDFDDDGSVNVPDLVTMLAAWGPCP